MTQHYHGGYSGKSYDRWVERNSNSTTLGKVQKQFWFTKSAVMRKLGKREDEYIVASDSELDTKIDLFKAIEESTRELQILLADYQNRICILAQEENTLGRLLKEYGKQDQTRAGKMMAAVGKSLSYTAQQRVALRNPLVRLFQEVDTFQSRAVEDTAHTVEDMEKVRTEYRGALMWMKNISQDFNPDQYQQLEKFREVQTLVKQKKSKFDEIKIKSLQKIELLAASRCNMFSHALILYQNNLITFSEKTAKTLNSVASNFKGYQPYKFHVIKELAEPEELMEAEEEDKEDNEMEGDDKTFFGSEYHDEDDAKKERKSLVKNRANAFKKKEKLGKDSDSLVNLFYNEETTDPSLSMDNESQNNTSKELTKAEVTSFSDIDLLCSDTLTPDTPNNSTAEILKEFFESPLHTAPEQSLPAFGTLNEKDVSTHSNSTDIGKNSQTNTTAAQLFMPSHLLDFGMKGFETHTATTASTPTSLANPLKSSMEAGFASSQSFVSPQLQGNTTNVSQSSGTAGTSNTSTKKHQAMSQQAKMDWYKVFQDIDPLSDPGSAIFGKGFADKKC